MARICSVSTHESMPKEPGRSFFVHDLGTLLAPDPDRCAVTKQSSGLVTGGRVSVEEQIREISLIR